MYENKIYINNREISLISPTYFIADVGASHDGDLERAKKLIRLARDSGADCVKFQHFKADQIVSDYGFQNLIINKSHQASWKKSVYQVYKHYECDRTWTGELVKTCKEVGVDFMTSPYDYEALDLLDKYLPAYKIGSGDITWLDFIAEIAKKNKPVILSTGASIMEDVEMAIDTILKYNHKIVLLQCNTNYTGKLENYKYINLRVLNSFSQKYPGMILGLSDHTPGHAAVLGAITLGARVIEKHFTDDNDREGPDHPFSLNPKAWREMIDRSRELELALGDGIKRIEKNEKDSAIVQRRCIRLKRDVMTGEVIKKEDIEFLRPAPKGSFKPCEESLYLGKTVLVSKKYGDALFTKDFQEK